MKIIHISAPENTPDFNAAIKRATAIADEQLGNNKQSDDNVRMECAICWEVYDPILGDPVWQIAPARRSRSCPSTGPARIATRRSTSLWWKTHESWEGGRGNGEG